MTRVDFYLLQAANAEVFTVKLCDKALAQGNRLYVYASDQAQAERLNEALWASDPGSFRPHDLADDADARTPLVIGTQAPTHDYDVLVQLAPEVPLCFSQFERVAEIVAPDDAAKAAGRERWAFYKHRGYQLQHHNI